MKYDLLRIVRTKLYLLKSHFLLCRHQYRLAFTNNVKGFWMRKNWFAGNNSGMLDIKTRFEIINENTINWIIDFNAKTLKSKRSGSSYNRVTQFSNFEKPE